MKAACFMLLSLPFVFVSFSCERAKRQPSVISKALPQEAQSILDRLNNQCGAEPWRSEVDMIECPDTRPENRIVSGEVSAFVSDCKERLAKHDVQVKWNAKTKQYQIDAEQDGGGQPATRSESK
jgi:hypothetical protein